MTSPQNIFEKIIPISATEGFNLSSVTESIIELLPEHPKYYPDDQLSDENERSLFRDHSRKSF